MSARKPLKSVERETLSGATRRFSSRADLVQFLRDGGDPIVDPQDARWSDIFQTWVQQGATGCRFAQHRARHVEETQYLSIAFEEITDEHVEPLQEVLRTASDSQAVVLVFPTVMSMNSLVQNLMPLLASEYWEFDVIPSAKDVHDPDHLNIGVRWPLPNSRYRSEALAFGPFEELPFTRRSPVAAIALRTLPPAKIEEDGRVHLAQMPLFGIEHEKGQYFWDKTKEGKYDLLAEELVHSARARVTFRVRKSEWPI